MSFESVLNRDKIKEPLVFFSLALLLREFFIPLLFFYSVHQILVKDKKEWLFKSLFYFFLIRFLNPTLFPESGLAILFSWLILLLVFFKIFFHRKENIAVVKYFYVFCVYCLIAALLKSDFLSLSLFKILSFFIGFLSVIVGIKAAEKNDWESFFVNNWVVMAILSLFTLFLPSVGFARNATGFQGIMNHPQFFGPYNAVISAIVFLSITQKSKHKKYLFLLLLLNFTYIFLSESRTALLAYLFVLLLMVYTHLKSLRRYLIPMSITGFIFVLALLINYSSVENKLINFLSKNREGTSTELKFDRLTGSRRALFLESVEAFNENPMLGIGFGVPQLRNEVVIKTIPGTSIPYSAPSEKGVLFSLLLEELGIVGTLLFIILCLSFLAPIIKNDNKYLSLFFSIFVLNMGEATFFSVNGMGVFLWGMMGLAYMRAMQNKRLKSQVKMFVKL